MQEWMAKCGEEALNSIPVRYRASHPLQIHFAKLLTEQGKYKEAEILYREALFVAEAKHQEVLNEITQLEEQPTKSSVAIQTAQLRAKTLENEALRLSSSLVALLKVQGFHEKAAPLLKKIFDAKAGRLLGVFETNLHRGQFQPSATLN